MDDLGNFRGGGRVDRVGRRGGDRGDDRGGNVIWTDKL